MALTELLGALEAEAAAEMDRLQADARAEATRIVEVAQGEAHAIGERVRLAGEEELLREVEGRLAAARLASTAQLRRTREECINTLLDALRDRLRSIRDADAYPAILRELLEEGLAMLPSATVVRVDPRDRSLAVAALAHLEVELRVAPTLRVMGGVEVDDDDGRTARNTLEERLHNATPALRLLFGDLLEEREPHARPATASETTP